MSKEGAEHINYHLPVAGADLLQPEPAKRPRCLGGPGSGNQLEGSERVRLNAAKRAADRDRALYEETKRELEAMKKKMALLEGKTEEEGEAAADPTFHNSDSDGEVESSKQRKGRRKGRKSASKKRVEAKDNPIEDLPPEESALEKAKCPLPECGGKGFVVTSDLFNHMIAAHDFKYAVENGRRVRANDDKWKLRSSSFVAM